MANYHGVIGNRDYIKLNGERRPFWEFLDRQPDGWLCSLAYQREDLPEGKIIHDCGAWSYKDEEQPKLGKNQVTPCWALLQYGKSARAGDIVVAPDHMLIPGKDLDSRRRFNRMSAMEFIQRCPSRLKPMAVIHGETLQERLNYANFLIDLGYDALAVGGIAGRASQKSMVLDIVSTIRQQSPQVWLHVLGISSPPYAVHWAEIGVNSFDGASHFKQAFTAGKFFVEQKGDLVGYQAARPGEEITAPICNCLACLKLRQVGIDTRTYGSNENNMGRAAHNLNQLIKAIKSRVASKEN